MSSLNEEEEEEELYETILKKQEFYRAEEITKVFIQRNASCKCSKKSQKQEITLHNMCFEGRLDELKVLLKAR